MSTASPRNVQSSQTRGVMISLLSLPVTCLASSTEHTESTPMAKRETPACAGAPPMAACLECLEPWLPVLLSRPRACLHLPLGAKHGRHAVLAAVAVALALATPVGWMNWQLLVHAHRLGPEPQSWEFLHFCMRSHCGYGRHSPPVLNLPFSQYDLCR